MRNKGCGPGLFNSGPLDFFFYCCVAHDEGYVMSAEMYARSLFNGRAELGRAEAIQLKILTDEQFFKCIRTRIDNCFWWSRPLVRFLGTLYCGMIAKYSNRYWVECVARYVTQYMMDRDSGRLLAVEPVDISDPFIQALLKETL